MTKTQPRPSGSVLLCLDGSPAAAAGLPYAVALARASGADILLLDVLESAGGSVPPPRAVDALGTQVARQAAVEYLQNVQTELEQRGLAVGTRLVEGGAATQIIQVADKEQVGVIVMATHGSHESTQFRLGGTAEKVAQHAHHSIFLARSTDPSGVDDALQRMVVLLDGSQAAEAALVSAETLAKERGAELVLGHVASRPTLPTCQPLMHSDQDLLDRLEARAEELARSYLRGLEQTLRREGLQVRHMVVSTQDTRQGALDMLREVRADLVVLASHGQTSSHHAVHGSLAQHLLGYSPIPTWVVQNLHRHDESFARAEQQQVVRLHADTGR